ncbi:MAG: hypothetical protein J7599_23075 [Niabella sp.]|nr:hypothetical protein [Niabella sp.]
MTINHHITDLNILTEILPVFNYTNNRFSEQVLAELLTKPLPSIAAIIGRQQVLQGFVKNYRILQSYNYAKAEFAEVHQFVEQVAEPVPNHWMALFTNKDELQVLISRYAQFVLFFDRLLQQWIAAINRTIFPEVYRGQPEAMEQLLTFFDLRYYAERLNENRFGRKEVRQLSQKIAARKKDGSWSLFWSRLFLFEAYTSISIAIVRHRFTFPVPGAKALTIRDLYHPLVKEPAKNDIHITKQVCLLTGPNMAGKSTLLRSIGLCVFLAHTGLAIPASFAEIPFFDHISVFINHRDDLQNGYSHFMYEIKNLKEVLQHTAAGRRCFAIFDELFKGTNQEDALAITTATIEGLSRTDTSCFLISTHLHALKETPAVAGNATHVYHIACVIENGRPGFTYKLGSGWSDLRIGRLLFEAEGLFELLNRQPTGA